MNKQERKYQAVALPKQKILDVTINILGTEGYAAVTANKITQRAQISKGALYHHFASLDEVKAMALSFLIEQFTQLDDLSQVDSVKEYLSNMGNIFFKSMMDQPVLAKAMHAFVTQSFVDESLRKQLQCLTDHVLKQYLHTFQYFYPHLSKKMLSEIVKILDAYFCGAGIQWFLLKDYNGCISSWKKLSEILIGFLESKAKKEKK